MSVAASCYSCGTDGNHGASFVADMNDGHAVQFLVTGLGITWVEMRNGVELVKLEGAEAIQELDRPTATYAPFSAAKPSKPDPLSWLLQGLNGLSRTLGSCLRLAPTAARASSGGRHISTSGEL